MDTPYNFCNQPFFTLYFSGLEFSRRFYSHLLFLSIFFLSLSLSLCLSLSLSLYISLSPLSLSLSLISPPSLYLSFYLSLYLSPSLSLLSIILFGVSNGRFRPCYATILYFIYADRIILKSKYLILHHFGMKIHVFLQYVYLMYLLSWVRVSAQFTCSQKSCFLHIPGCLKQFFKYCRACTFFDVCLRMLIPILNDVDMQLILEFKTVFENIIQYGLKFINLFLDMLYIFSQVFLCNTFKKCTVFLRMIEI